MPKILPPLCTAVNNLRQTLGWTEAELGERLGVRSNVISDYVRDQRELDRQKAEELIAAMGLGPEALDEELRVIEAARRKASTPVYPMAPGGAVAERGRLESFVQRLSYLVAEAARPAAALFSVELRAVADEQNAWTQLQRLRRLSQADRLKLVRKSREYRNWALCKAACAESLRFAPRSAQEALDWASLAVEIADRLPCEELFRQRMQGVARLHLANAQRVAGQQRTARDTLAQALVLLKNGAPADPGLLDEAQLLSLEASLYIDQRRPAEALDRLDRALAVDRGGLKAHLLTQRARALEQLGDYEGAVATLREATPLVVASDRRMQWVVRFNLLGNLCHLRRFDEAPPLLTEVQALAIELGNDLDHLRTRWLAGWVRAGQGRRDEAIAILEKVRDDFTARRIAYDTSLVILELAALYQEEGRTAEVKALAVRLAWVFNAEGVEREALAALRLFCEAAREETLTVALVRELADYLYRAQHDPELRFEGAR